MTRLASSAIVVALSAPPRAPCSSRRKTGQYLKLATTQSSNKLLTSIMNAFGHPATGLGIEPTCGPLAGVL